MVKSWQVHFLPFAPASWYIGQINLGRKGMSSLNNVYIVYVIEVIHSLHSVLWFMEYFPDFLVRFTGFIGIIPISQSVETETQVGQITYLTFYVN
jgi:hypothetical protein